MILMRIVGDVGEVIDVVASDNAKRRKRELNLASIPTIRTMQSTRRIFQPLRQATPLCDDILEPRCRGCPRQVLRDLGIDDDA